MNPERSQRQIQSVISTIWHESGNLQCPVCATPMAETENYHWECNVSYCPIDSTEFNEKIHNYAVSSNLSHVYRNKHTSNRY